MDWIGFVKSVVKDVWSELKKWGKGSTTLNSLPGQPRVTHVQGVVVFLVFMMVMAGIFSYQASAIKVGAAAGSTGGGGGGKPVSFDGWDTATGNGGSAGTVDENGDAGEATQEILDKNLAEVKFTLTWTDEPDNDRRHANQPDELGVEVTAPWGEAKNASAKNDASSKQGLVTFSFTVAQKKYNGDNGTGDWAYTVFAKACGDHTPKRIGLFMILDNGNAYDLKVDWKYFVKKGK